MKYTTIFFDLDGTLTDSAPGIINSVKYALEHYGAPIPPYDTLRKFIGPPLTYSFKEYCGFSEEQAAEGVWVYREYFADKGKFENAPYDGIEDTLAALKSAGYRLAVATSKPDIYSEQILDHFGLMKYFDFLAGNTLDEKRPDKIQVIKYALEELGITDPSEVIMVGDRKYDILGGKKFGMCTLGVEYGFGTYEELSEAGADYICKTVENMKNKLIEIK